VSAPAGERKFPPLDFPTPLATSSLYYQGTLAITDKDTNRSPARQKQGTEKRPCIGRAGGGRIEPAISRLSIVMMSYEHTYQPLEHHTGGSRAVALKLVSPLDIDLLLQVVVPVIGIILVLVVLPLAG